MRIHRLLGITMYLLNREKVGAKTLAEKFEVSERTIQRDMEALNLAGIPVISTQGTGGGYEIMDGYGIQKKGITHREYKNIITAMRGLCSAYGNVDFETTLEKLITGEKNDEDQKLVLDFSVMKENHEINQYIKSIEDAIDGRRIISFDYSNSQGSSSKKKVESIAVIYKWYAWYMIGYSHTREDYLMFKLARMDNLQITDEEFTRKHESSEEILNRIENKDSRKYFDIKLLCSKEIRSAAREYLKGEIIQELEDDSFIMKMCVPEGERMWFSLLMGFGDSVRVIEPQVLKRELKQKAQEIIGLY